MSRGRFLDHPTLITHNPSPTGGCFLKCHQIFSLWIRIMSLSGTLLTKLFVLFLWLSFSKGRGESPWTQSISGHGIGKRHCEGKEEKKEDDLGSQRQTTQYAQYLRKMVFPLEITRSLCRNSLRRTESTVWVCSPTCRHSPYCRPPTRLQWAGFGMSILP